MPFANNLKTVTRQWERLCTNANIQNSCQSSQNWTSQQIHLKVRPSNAQRKTLELQASISMLNDKVHDIIIRKQLNKYDLFRKVFITKLFSLKRTWQDDLDSHSWIWTQDQSGDVLTTMHGNTYWKHHTSTNSSWKACRWGGGDLDLFLVSLQSLNRPWT